MRWRMRCASSIWPLSSKKRTRSSSSWWIVSTARSTVGLETTYCVAGKTVRSSTRAKTSPVSGSKWVICSISSPKRLIR